MKQLLRLLNKRNKNLNNGYSLAELLLGAALSTVVISLAGNGIISALNTNKAVATNLKANDEIERALSFMSNEAKQAVKIKTDVSDLPPEFTKPATAEIALMLQMPKATTETPIIYYVDNPESDSSFSGPKQIYRWGPKLNNEGDYANSSQPANWSYEPLVADISDQSLSVDCGSWTAVPDPSTAIGAYSCVDSSQKIARILVNREIDSNSANNNTLVSDTTVFARAGEPVDVALTISPLEQLFGKLPLPGPSDLNFKIIGGEITCGAGGADIPVSSQIKINDDDWQSFTDEFTLSVGEADKVDVKGIAQGNSQSAGCENFSKEFEYGDPNDTQQIKVLGNGDELPNIPAFDNQTSIEQFLQDYIVVNENGEKEIKLNDNELLVLFELGTTDKSKKIFDLQDLVVLVSVNPQTSQQRQ